MPHKLLIYWDVHLQRKGQRWRKMPHRWERSGQKGQTGPRWDAIFISGRLPMKHSCHSCPWAFFCTPLAGGWRLIWTGTHVSDVQIIQPAAGQERTQKDWKSFSPNCVTAHTAAKATTRWEFPRESQIPGAAWRPASTGRGLLLDTLLLVLYSVVAPLQVRFHFEVLVGSHKAHRICTWAARAGKFEFLDFFCDVGASLLFPCPLPFAHTRNHDINGDGVISRPGCPATLTLANICSVFCFIFGAFVCVFLTPSDHFSQLGTLIWERPLIDSSSVNSHFFCWEAFKVASKGQVEAFSPRISEYDRESLPI